MHICWVNSSVMWFPYWTVHFTSFDGCPWTISTWWVLFSVTTLRPFFYYYQFGMFSLPPLYLKTFVYGWAALVYLLATVMYLYAYCPMLWWFYRLDISEDKFIRYFWWCWNKLKVIIHLVPLYGYWNIKKQQWICGIFLWVYGFLGNNHWSGWKFLLCLLGQDWWWCTNASLL